MGKTKYLVVSRKFGLRPDITNGKLDDAFLSFNNTVNAMIRYGLKKDDELFRREGLISVKKFYDTMRCDPALNDTLKSFGLRERLRRCSTQFAYFSVREYKIRSRMISDIAAVLLEYEDLSILFEKGFPSDSLINNVRRELPRTHEGKRRSHEFLKTLCLQLKNVLKSLLEGISNQNITRFLKIANISKLKGKIITWIKENRELYYS